MSLISNIEKLNKSNYDTWKLQMEAILIKNDHWDFIDGTRPFDDTEGAKWDQGDRKAKADIVLAISPGELCHIRHCVTAKEVWEKLQSVYQSKGPAKKATLLKQLLFHKMAENETMSEHLNSFLDTVDKLKELDIDVADDLLSILMLYSIPSTFENFRCAMETRDELPRPEALKIKLLEEFEARKGKTAVTQEAYFSLRKPSPGRNLTAKDYPQKNNKFRNYKCSYCSRTGHKASECWKKQADRKAEKSKESSMVVKTKSDRAFTASTTPENKSSTWCLDSGATSHMCNDINMFTDVKEVTDSFVKLADDKDTEITAQGTVRITVPCEAGIRNIRLKNVLCVPHLKHNLMSTSKATADDRTVIFTNSSAKIIDPDGEEILCATRFGNLYYVNTLNEIAATVTDLQKWHQKYGHLNENDLKKLQSNEMVRGLSFTNCDSIKDCKICIQCKQTADAFPKESKFVSKQLLDLIHSDVCGPMSVPSLGGSRYFATFIDNKSRYVEVCFLKTKDEVRKAFIKFKATVENQTGKKIKTLRTDNGLEYCGVDFNEFLIKEGIRREKSAALTPQQNGVAERMNRTLAEMARCMLKQANLPTSFWAEAVMCAAFLRNRAPTRSLKENITPYQALFDRKPSVSFLKVFGQKAYVLNKRLKGKFDPRSEEHIFVGYSPESKAYRLWNNRTRKIVVSRDVKFIDEFQNFLPSEIEVDLTQPHLDEKREEPSTNESDESSQKEDDDVKEQPPESKKKQRAPGRPKILRSGKRGRPKKQYHMKHINEADSAEEINNSYFPPCVTVKQALNSPYSEEWKRAMNHEFESLVKQKCWELVDRPSHKKVIGSKWVLKTKYKEDGSIEKFKARLVAKGCSQSTDDYEEIFSPVARLSSIRTVAAYAIENGLTAYQIDFVMAYINGELDEEIFMELPEGFQDSSDGDKVCLLKRSLYGLKQSGRQWYKKLDSHLKSLDLKPLSADSCVYHKKSSDAEIIIIVYVDDLIVFTNNEKSYEFIRNNLENSFQMKDLGLLHYCLGLQFKQDEKSMKISQSKYIDDILSKFKMTDANPVSTPLDPGLKLTKDMSPKDEKEKMEMKDIPYRPLIGSLMYLSVATRPDITYAVNFLSQFNNNPGKAHWIAAKRVLRYLKGTQDYGIQFTKSGNPLTAFVDADWASSLDDRRSHTGYVFRYANGPVTWESRKQRTVALSSTEAEYMALSEVSKECVHLRRFLDELTTQPAETPTVVYCDNQSAQKLVRNPVYHSRTKHIDIRHHFVREIYERGELDVKYLCSSEMPADVLTKGLGASKHKTCVDLIGITNIT